MVENTVQNSFLKVLTLATLLLSLSGCQVFRGVDVPATLQAQNTSYSLEATAIAQTQQAEADRVLATAQAAETYIAQEEGINQALVATVRAGDPPTIARSVGSAPGAALTPGTGETAFVEIQTASSVREADGCADSPQSQFPADISEIYVTARALNIRAGTRMDVEWRYEGQLIWQDTWTVPVDSENFCLWFNLDPSVVTLSPGNWSARLFADGSALEPAASFSILDAMTEEEGG